MNQCTLMFSFSVTIRRIDAGVKKKQELINAKIIFCNYLDLQSQKLLIGKAGDDKTIATNINSKETGPMKM